MSSAKWRELSQVRSSIIHVPVYVYDSLCNFEICITILYSFKHLWKLTLFTFGKYERWQELLPGKYVKV